MLANGSPIAGAIEAEITTNNHYAADRFRIAVALNADPTMGPSFWCDTNAIKIDVQLALPGPVAAFAASSWQSLLQGRVDTVEIDPIAGIASLNGRDFTAALIEARTQETFANRTSSEIAVLIAHRRALTPQVTTTTTPVGQYYQLEHDRITLDQFSRAMTEWDLLCFLAQQEGFDVYVEGTTLVFAPAASLLADPFILRPLASALGPANVTDLRLERALTLAGDIEVTVKSWNARQRTAFVQTAQSKSQSDGASGAPQTYVFVRPNLTLAEAMTYAQTKLAELTRHERTLVANMPGELSLTARSILVLQGTGTGFDQSYFVDEIQRSLSAERGFTQTIRARNMSPSNRTTTPADAVGAVTG